MANTKSAEKALRQSKKRTTQNNAAKAKIRGLIRSLKTKNANPDILEENYKELQSVLDKAAKNNVIHKNKADRLKSRMLKLANATAKPTNSKRASL